MARILTIVFSALFIVSCSTSRKLHSQNETPASNTMPACLQAIVKRMAAEPNGSPQSVARYSYKAQTVYYLVSPCCDKYNIVFDSACNILGYPDGGFTGKGDGKMLDFATGASGKEIIWKKN